MSIQLLFVYGGLTEGLFQSSSVRGLILSECAAIVRGTAFRLKIGSAVLSLEGTDYIKGKLFELAPSEVLWPLLDVFYGFNEQEPNKSSMLRKIVNVKANETLTSAWVYVIPPEKVLFGAETIHGGDWETNFKANPPLIEKLTEKQKKYVQKLGASSGREIVPIDLNLYRELMGLELIVDKGRRLALSRLGNELYHQINFYAQMEKAIK